MAQVWIYANDTFKPTPLDEGARGDLGFLESYARSELGVVGGVKRVLIGPTCVEFIFRTSCGEQSVKFLFGDDPTEALLRFYEHERAGEVEVAVGGE